MPGGAKPHKRRRRLRLYQEQRGLCYWCRVPMLPVNHGRFAWTIDHFGLACGAYRPVVLAHSACNSARAHDPAPPEALMKAMRKKTDEILHLIARIVQENTGLGDVFGKARGRGDIYGPALCNIFDERHRVVIAAIIAKRTARPIHEGAWFEFVSSALQSSNL